MDSGDESYHDLISTEMIENFCDGRESHPNVNRRESRYKIRHFIWQRQPEWKGVLKATQSMGKGLQKVFKTSIKGILQDLPPLGESGSEVSYFIPGPRNCVEVTKSSDDINKSLRIEIMK